MLTHVLDLSGKEGGREGRRNTRKRREGGEEAINWEKGRERGREGGRRGGREGAHLLGLVVGGETQASIVIGHRPLVLLDEPPVQVLPILAALEHGLHPLRERGSEGAREGREGGSEGR